MNPFKLLPLTALLLCSASQAADVREQRLKDLNGYFPFNAPASLDQWTPRKEFIRRQILVSQGLWPMPTKTPLNTVIHGKVDCGEYTVEKVYFESAPGLYVTGNLYRPKKVTGKVPGVMFAHGHWRDARLSEVTGAKLRTEIASGQERFESGGQSRFQSMCVQLARMGCVVWQWDMLSDSDSVQFSRDIIHSFAKQRPEMNTLENWGLYSPQAEARLQSVMGIQTWNAIRGLDFLLGLPEVDPERTAITGSSGGGTQTMLLAAVDDRIKLSFPVVMVSTAMQGGCTCENASLLRVNTGNVEFSALFAPKPQGMNTADDWTKELATKGFPDLQSLYGLYGKKENVLLHRGEHFPHNYNAVTRSAFYTFLNKHFRLGLEAPVIESDYTPLSREQLSVWDAEHPAPKPADPEFEKALLRWFDEDARAKLLASAGTPGGLKREIAPALEVMIGRTLETAGDSEWQVEEKKDQGAHLQFNGKLINTTHAEEVRVSWLHPKDWKGAVVVWLGSDGKAGLFLPSGALRPAVQSLLDAGVSVVGADLFQQNLAAHAQARVVDSPREFAGYTFGYNHSLFAQRTHDVLTLLRFLKSARVGSHPSPKRMAVLAQGTTGPVCIVARALAGDAVEKVAAATGGFRFGKLLDYRDRMFLPGGAKYLDLPGMMALNAPAKLWVADEVAGSALIENAYKDAPSNFQRFNRAAEDFEKAAVDWLLK